MSRIKAEILIELSHLWTHFTFSPAQENYDQYEGHQKAHYGPNYRLQWTCYGVGIWCNISLAAKNRYSGKRSHDEHNSYVPYLIRKTSIFLFWRHSDANFIGIDIKTMGQVEIIDRKAASVHYTYLEMKWKVLFFKNSTQKHTMQR